MKLTIGGRDYTQPLTVRKDPHSEGPRLTSPRRRHSISTLRDGLNLGVYAVNQLEFMRAQVQSICAGRRHGGEADGHQGARCPERARTNLYDLRITGGQDGVRYAAKLLSRFSYLANGVSGSDFKPTDQHLEVAKLLAERMQTQLGSEEHGRKGRGGVQRAVAPTRGRTGGDASAVARRDGRP